ncbi:hypothetical protein SGM_5063 [Streptomyces griseoaurantiacus M045]|uniref:Uncharacterized protein n=1 Tax=Streptomyces griseoaurantiacus M045 TaxID=996637 RepID=F3NPY8_9ACTN|nr:hypothetical protein SGM_5063 [Streptomyces griseoaurantiacus M045]
MQTPLLVRSRTVRSRTGRESYPTARRGGRGVKSERCSRNALVNGRKCAHMGRGGTES